MVLFAQVPWPFSAKEFLSQNDKINDMFNPTHRDSLVSFTLDIFKDMRPKDSAVDYFIRNTCGMNNFKDTIDESKVMKIIESDVFVKEFRLSGDGYDAIKSKLIRTVEKVIELGKTKEGVLNFIAIPRTHNESLNNKFYASLSQGVPVSVPDDAESFYDSLQKNPSSLEYLETGSYAPVCPQGRLLRSALTKDNKDIVVIRLRTMDPTVQAKYEKKVARIAEMIVNAIPVSQEQINDTKATSAS